MSRSFIGGSGSDTTAAAIALLTDPVKKSLEVCDLIVIHTAPSLSGGYLDKTFLITNYGAPLKWDYRGTFVPAQFTRNEVASKIGLEADTLQIDWGPSDNDILATNVSSGTLTALQGFQYGVFDNGVVEVWRCLMPTPGDANTIGACLLFGGRIGDIKPSRMGVSMTIMSRLELLNIQVPTNMVEPTNIIAQYVTGQIPFGTAVVTTIGPKCMPWDTTVNPSYPYGIGDGTTATIIDITALQGYAVGATLKISCSGLVRASDARPLVGPAGQPPATGTRLGSTGTRFPTYYITGSTIGLAGAVGTITNSSGVITGSPFDVGTSASATIPAGGTLLALGIDDDKYNDNAGHFTAVVSIDVSGPSGLTIAAGSTVSKVYADATTPLGAGSYNGGYIIFGSGKLQGIYRSIRIQTIESGHFAFYIYPDLPYEPDAGDTLGAYVVMPTDYATSLAIGVGFAGFPFVPSPVNSSMVIA